MAMEKGLIKHEGQFLVVPEDIVAMASRQATVLMDIVNKTECFQEIGGKKYLQVEAWETIGAFNRVNAIPERVSPIKQGDEIVGYEAEVGLYKDGLKVGAGIMPCYFTEPACRGKEGDSKHKAAMSAAQTFATSKAYRLNYSYVAILAGYQPMPAEELTEEQKPQPKGHWCAEHKTAFFKRGKMKNWAHPIKDANGKDTGKWCNEHKAGEVKKEPEPEDMLAEELPVEGEDKEVTPTITTADLPKRSDVRTLGHLFSAYVKHFSSATVPCTSPEKAVLALLTLIDKSQIADAGDAWAKVVKIKTGIEIE